MDDNEKICKKVLITKKSRKSHLQMLHKPEKFRCNFCFKSFRQKRYLRDHEKRVHKVTLRKKKSNMNRRNMTNFEFIGSPIPITPSQSTFISKSVSPQNFNNVDEYTKIADQSNATFKCNLCCEKFHERNKLRFHNLFSCDRRRYPCPKCDMRYCQKTHLDRHLNQHKFHNHKCYVCGMDFYAKIFLDEHQRVKGHQDENKIETFTIDINKELVGCDTTEVSNSGSETSQQSIKVSKRILKENRVYISEFLFDYDSDDFEVQKTFDCYLCVKTYEHETSLKRHLKEVHEKNLSSFSISPNYAKMFSPERKHACFLCDLRFTLNKTLQDHLRSHQNFIHECRICKFKYWKIEILAEHQRRTHKFKSKKIVDQKIRKNSLHYKCKICSRPFSNKTHCNRHIRNVHGTYIGNPLNISNLFSLKRPYGCDQCDLRFNYEKILKRHINSHRLLQFKFKCEECDFFYWKEEILKEHQKRAHEGKGYSDREEKEVFDVPKCDLENFAPKFTCNMEFSCQQNVDANKNDLASSSEINTHEEENNLNQSQFEEAMDVGSDEPQGADNEPGEDILDAENKNLKPLNLQKCQSSTELELDKNENVIIVERERNSTPSELNFGCCVCRTYFSDGDLLFQHLIDSGHL